MPHNAVGSPCPDCSCATCACRLCFTAQGCGAAVEFDWGVYSAAGCTGGALFTGHAARGAAPCVCLGEPGTYWIQITPTGDDSALWRPRCYQVVMTAEDCAGGKEITIPLSPYTHSVEIDVTGCCGCAQRPTVPPPPAPTSGNEPTGAVTPADPAPGCAAPPARWPPPAGTSPHR